MKLQTAQKSATEEVFELGKGTDMEQQMIDEGKVNVSVEDSKITLTAELWGSEEHVGQDGWVIFYNLPDEPDNFNFIQPEDFRETYMLVGEKEPELKEDTRELYGCTMNESCAIPLEDGTNLEDGKPLDNTTAILVPDMTRGGATKENEPWCIGLVSSDDVVDNGNGTVTVLLEAGAETPIVGDHGEGVGFNEDRGTVDNSVIKAHCDGRDPQERPLFAFDVSHMCEEFGKQAKEANGLYTPTVAKAEPTVDD